MSGVVVEDLPAAPPPWAPEPASTSLAKTLGVAALTAELSACGGGGGGATASSPAPVAPSSPPTPAPITVADAGRFLTQATLGFARSDVTSLVSSNSFSDWMTAQFAVPRSQGHYDWLVANGYNAAANINSQTGMDNTIWRKFISSPDALRQRVVLALSEICVVSVLGINAQWRQFSVANYLDILEANAFGNYRTLLQQVSLSPAMGYYLTYRGSVKANPTTGSEPDENYSRELMQLFTIGLVMLNGDGSVQTDSTGAGIPTYTQADVSGLARVFTGWNVDVSNLTSPYPPDFQQRPMVSTASSYETGAKTFLGTTIASGTSAINSMTMALDTLFNHANLPTFVSKQLIQHLVTSNPSAAYIARVSAAFVNNGANVRGDMQAVLTAILLDTEARSATTAATTTFGKLREPIVRFLNWARTYQATSASNAWAIGDLSDTATKLGQSPMRSGSVFNFFRPGYVPPNTALSTLGLTGPEFQITDESSVAGYVNFMQKTVSGSGIGDVTPDYSSLTALAATSGSLLTEINQVLAGSQVSTATLTTIQAAIDTMPSATAANLQSRVNAALVLVMATPEYIAQK